LVYCRSFKYDQNVSNALLLSKFLFSASSLSTFALLLLASLSLGTVLIEIIEKCRRITKRKAEYKIAYRFCLELLAMYISGELAYEEIIIRENELNKTLQFIPCEKYNKQEKLNGFEYHLGSLRLEMYVRLASYVLIMKLVS